MPAMVQDDPKHTLIQANVLHQYSVTPTDLPLSCPMPGMYLWNSHPRVYLAIEATGWAKCSYCGAEYTLVRTPHEVIQPGVQRQKKQLRRWRAAPEKAVEKVARSARKSS